MPKVSVVVSSLIDWKPYYPSKDISDVDSYLAAQQLPIRKRVILNLCRNYRYLSHGYYCSLLAESRGQTVIPSISTINNLSNKSLYLLDLDPVRQVLARVNANTTCEENQEPSIKIYFGMTRESDFRALARTVFEQFPCPVLEIRFSKDEQRSISRVRMIGINTLNDGEQTEFSGALDRFSRNIWREPKGLKRYSYDLAMLVNLEEALPPSNAQALKRFEKAARDIGIDVDRVTRRDFSRLAEYDALFIRETTAINDHTYRFAKRAESQGSIVMDDPRSILRCTNKIYLANLMRVNNIPTPKTVILNRHQAEDATSLVYSLSYPVVLKIPDGSFSRGVIKANNAQELVRFAAEFFNYSALILAQEFYPTDYDWRIGVLNGEVLFACQYFMSRGHWQIYKHGKNGQVSSGDFKTLAVDDVPAGVIDIARAAAALVGNGLYGVDLKQRGDDVVIIEINDNPNIDAGIEDQCLGPELYRRLAGEFRRRLDIRAGHD